MMVEANENEGYLCKHNPSPKKGIKSILDYFLHRHTLLDGYTYTARCSSCGKLLSVPVTYIHPITKVLYGAVSAVLDFVILVFSKDLEAFFIGELIAIVVLFVLIHAISSLILAVCPWREEKDEYNELVLRYRNKPTKHKLDKVAAVVAGLNMAKLLTLWSKVLLGR